MINDIINALSRVINKYLNVNGNKYTIYTENVEQGLNRPCFFIYCKDYKDERYRGNRYKVNADIVIEYLPAEEENINADVNSIIEDLYDITEYINIDDNLLQGNNRLVENAENCVIFNVSYGFFYCKTADVEIMENLKERTDVNG